MCGYQKIQWMPLETNPCQGKILTNTHSLHWQRYSKSKSLNTQVLVPEIKAASISLASFNNMFIPFGLPMLVIIDLNIIHKHMIIILLETLCIPYYIVPPESHNSILCQILDKFFNKIQCFHATDFLTYEQWILGIIFIIYAWNASTIYVTDHNCIILRKLDTYSYSNLIKCKTQP